MAGNIFRNGDFEMLDWIFENKLIISAQTCNEIVQHGRLDILKKIIKYGCWCDYYVCDIA